MRVATSPDDTMKLSAFTAANLALAFALELAAFTALGFGAFNLADSTGLGVLLAACTLLAATVSWGAVAAPRAPFRHRLVTTPVKALVFAGAVLALAVTGHLALGIGLGAVAAVNASLLHHYKPGGRLAVG